MRSDHWLWRMNAAAWLNCSQHELELATASFASRRKAITHLRRCGGMALNAVLYDQYDRKLWSRQQCETMWGRSYLEHLRQFDREVNNAILAPDARRYADLLLARSPIKSQLVQIGSAPDAELRLAYSDTKQLLEICIARVTQGQISSS